MEKPRWLDDEKELLKLLNNFVDRLGEEPTNPIKKMGNIRITSKRFPELFRHNDESDREWSRIQKLADKYGIFTIIPFKNLTPYDPKFFKSSLKFNVDAELYLREWLGRPKKIPYAQEWHSAVSSLAENFLDAGQGLIDHPLTVTGKTAKEVVFAFSQINRFISEGLTLRQLSSRCFWGTSKYLDNREDLLNTLFEDVNIHPRPVLVHMFLPEISDGILFVENYDTYINLVNGNFQSSNNHIVVYVSGMRGSAKRIRNESEVSFHLHSSSAFHEFEWFNVWWITNSCDTSPKPLYFWGYLDYSGLSILKTLRDRFGDVQAWEPGYSLLVERLKAGLGHDAKLADKEGQAVPVSIGCYYSDTVLLPLMKRLNRFIDQESV